MKKKVSEGENETKDWTTERMRENYLDRQLIRKIKLKIDWYYKEKKKKDWKDVGLLNPV